MPLNFLTQCPFRIGNTPLAYFRVHVSGLDHALAIKEERLNEFGSVKDRVAWYVLSKSMAAAREAGHIVDASSGNYGYALACIGQKLGLKVTIVSSPSISAYNAAGIRNAGANLVIAEPQEGESSNAARMRVAGDVAAAEGAVFLDQYRSADNPESHAKWTAPEVFGDDDWDACFVAASSGGTARGFADYLASHDESAELHLVDPFNSRAFADPSPNEASKLFIPGYGSGRRSSFAETPFPLDPIRIDEAEVMAACLNLRDSGLIDIGLSSTGVMLGAVEWLSQQTDSKTVVCICADGSERYVDEIDSRYLKSVPKEALKQARLVVDRLFSGISPLERAPRLAQSVG